MPRKPASFSKIRQRQLDVERKWLQQLSALDIGPQAISEEYGINRVTLHRMLKRHARLGCNIKLEQHRPSPAEYRAAAKQQMSRQEAADYLGVSYWTVVSQATSLNIQFRDARHPKRVKIDPKTLKPITPADPGAPQCGRGGKDER